MFGSVIMFLKVVPTTCMEKNLLNREPYTSPLLNKQSILKNETFAFQVALKVDLYVSPMLSQEIITPKIVKGDGDIKVYEVKNIPSRLSRLNRIDGGYEDNGKSGLYPDCLNLLNDGDSVVVSSVYWNSIYVEFTPNETTKIGNNEITVEFYKEDKKVGETTVSVKVIDAELPELTIANGQWFHCDALSSHYGVEPLSEEHWEIIENYIKFYKEYQYNMILTPIITPMIDTLKGGERATVQLVDVILDNGEYSFKFDKLKRWVDLCRKYGINKFEMPPLFSQHGAKFTPKVVATVDGEYKKLFFWDEIVPGGKYNQFLDKFLPALSEFIDKEGMEPYFHISDEPLTYQMDDYRIAHSMVYPHLSKYRFIEACSDNDFYKEGIMDIAITAVEHVRDFYDIGCKDYFVYHCNGHYYEVPNRFLSMKQSRNRILGPLIYKFDITGFITWGFNFWFSTKAIYPIDPYATADCDGWFPGGDAFSVYPGKDKNGVPSIRLKVFLMALQDHRLCKLLESYIGKEEVVKILDENVKGPDGNGLEFYQYPFDNDYMIDLRMRLNAELEKHINK